MQQIRITATVKVGPRYEGQSVEEAYREYRDNFSLSFAELTAGEIIHEIVETEEP